MKRPYSKKYSSTHQASGSTASLTTAPKIYPIDMMLYIRAQKEADQKPAYKHDFFYEIDKSFIENFKLHARGNKDLTGWDLDTETLIMSCISDKGINAVMSIMHPNINAMMKTTLGIIVIARQKARVTIRED